jgi:hypothetical protein
MSKICKHCSKRLYSFYCINNRCKNCCDSTKCKKHNGIPISIENLEVLKDIIDIPDDLMNIICNYIDGGKKCEICEFRRIDGKYQKCSDCKKICCKKCINIISCCSSYLCKNCHDPYNDYNNYNNYNCNSCESSRRLEEEYQNFKSLWNSYF